MTDTTMNPSRARQTRAAPEPHRRRIARRVLGWAAGAVLSNGARLDAIGATRELRWQDGWILRRDDA